MGLKIKIFDILGVSIQFSGQVHEKPIWRGDWLKRRVGQFADGWAWQERRELFLRRVVDTPMHTMSSQNNLKVTTDSYERKCLLVITKNKKHSSKQVVPITYTLEKRVFAVATFQSLWVVCFQTKWKICVVYFTLFESSLHF